jgi:hypothetical protein
MPVLGKLILAATLVAATGSVSWAADPRCSRPPYGGSADRYRAILETHGQKAESVAPTLEAICNMKFSGADRGPLLKLGFSDQEIERLDTATLAVDMMNGARTAPK